MINFLDLCFDKAYYNSSNNRHCELKERVIKMKNKIFALLLIFALISTLTLIGCKKKDNSSENAVMPHESNEHQMNTESNEDSEILQKTCPVMGEK